VERKAAIFGGSLLRSILAFLLFVPFFVGQVYANESIRLQLKWQHAFQFAGYYAAKELGYYDEAGLNVEIVPANTQTDVYDEVASGRAQYGVGNSGILIRRDQGLPLVVLNVVFQHSPAVFIAKNNIITLHDWHTKNIMLEKSSDELLLYLERSSLSTADMTFIPHSFEPTDILSENVDIMSAYVTNEPFFLAQQNIPFKIFSPRSMGIDFFGDNLFTSEAELKNHPERVEAFQDASMRGWQYALDNQETVVSWILSRYKNTYSRDFLLYEARETYNLVEPKLVELGYINESRWYGIAKSYQALGKLSAEFSIQDALYTPTAPQDWRKVILVTGISSAIILALGVLVVFVARTNNKLDHALKDSQKARTEAHKQANLDPLTELPNRRFFQSRLQELCRFASQEGSCFALFYLDLDHFKEINDIHGHQEGDKVLKEVSVRLLRILPFQCELARIGGDEFTILLPNSPTIPNLEKIAEKILASLHAPFKVGAGMDLAYLSASIGITLGSRDATDPSSLLQFADEAMYSAKKQGRSRWCLFSKSLHEEMLDRQKLLKDLRLAVKNQELFVVYQPILDLQTQTVCKFEALVRWQHKERGPIAPDTFIPLAEESGLIIQIGDFVFKESIKQLSVWRETLHPDLIMSINTSPFQYDEAGKHLNHWYSYLEEMQVPGQAVLLEITENMLIRNTQNVSRQLLSFRDHGINVALDDFGTGYSSLAYLNELDIDIIKIDKSFIRDLDKGAASQALCEAIISMAHKLNLKVVAEGIETQEQASVLSAYRCDLGQGYLFAKPLSADDATLFLRNSFPQ